MGVDIPVGLIWPARAAYASAIIFIAASGGTNLIYGWNKGTDLASSLVWAAVSVGVSIIFALSWPALSRNVENRSASRAVLIFVGMLLTGTYSVVAALGSASGGRTEAAAQEGYASSARARSQAVYDAARTELAGLQPTRSAGELETIIASAKPVCRIVVTQSRRDTVCTKPPALLTELARAKRREDLSAKMERAATDLSSNAPKAANTDATALVSYLAAVGIHATTDRLNKLLVLLTVLVVECGGGVSLAIAISLSADARKNRKDENRDPVTAGNGQTTLVSGSGGHPAADCPSCRTKDGRAEADTWTGHLPKIPLPAEPLRCPSVVSASTGQSPDTSSFSASGVRLLSVLRERGGVLSGGQRAMARMLGWSKSRLNEVLHELASDGAVKLVTGSRGTVVELA